MTKGDLIDAVQTATEKAHALSKTAVADVIDSTFEAISKSIRKEGRFQVPGFGTFSVRSRKARMGRNPQTGAELKIKASKSVGFKAAPKLKEKL